MGLTSKHMDAFVVHQSDAAEGPANIMTSEDVVRRLMKDKDGKQRPLVLGVYSKGKATVGVVQAKYVNGNHVTALQLSSRHLLAGSSRLCAGLKVHNGVFMIHR